MKHPSVKEIYELSVALVSVEYTVNVRVLLDRYEAGEISLDEVLTELSYTPGQRSKDLVRYADCRRC